MDDLPELPFELVFSYLSLSDLIKARVVSKSWRTKIDSFRPKSLCCSERPSGFIKQKRQWVRGKFAKNFICSARLDAFLITFHKSILSNLKSLRLFNLDFWTVKSARFVAAINSFALLEELVIIGIIVVVDGELYQNIWFELSLPMLTSIHIENLAGIAGLTLNTPRLLKIQMLDCAYAQLEIVHGESVEWLFVDGRHGIEMEQLKNLKYLYTNDTRINRTLLSSLEELREVHLQNSEYIEELQQRCRDKIADLFEQKQRYGRTSLKIFYCGCLLSGQNDPAIDALTENSPRDNFLHLAENASRLADKIPFYEALDYATVQRVAPSLRPNVLSRLTDCHVLLVKMPVQNVQDFFLDFLDSFDQIVDLKFLCDQPQDLFDQLPEHCDLESLRIRTKPADLRFLSRLQGLTYLRADFPVDVSLIRKLLEELPLLALFEFSFMGDSAEIRERPKDFEVRVGRTMTGACDRNAVMRFFCKQAGEEYKEVKSKRS